VNCESDPGKFGSLSVSSYSIYSIYSTYSMRTIHYVPLGLPHARRRARTVSGCWNSAFLSNSRPSECNSSWFAHFDSDKMMRHHRDVEKDLRYGLLEPEPARFRRSSACFGS
jgi:hypothetical protein